MKEIVMKEWRQDSDIMTECENRDKNKANVVKVENI